MIIDQAFILAAGKGTRLRPYTQTCPKPMTEIGGRPILDHTLDHLTRAGVSRVAMNLHHLGEQIEAAYKDRPNPEILFSREPELLETGAGVKNALHLMKDAPFYLINGDALWTDPPEETAPPALQRLSDAWQPDHMDILLLLQPLDRMTLTKGAGDYRMKPDGSRTRRCRRKRGDYMFTGIRIVHPRIFKDTPQEPFSFLELMDRAEKSGRLHAIPHLGQWHHISTPEDLENVRKSYRDFR